MQDQWQYIPEQKILFVEFSLASLDMKISQFEDMNHVL